MPPDRYKVGRVNQDGMKIDTLAGKKILFLLKSPLKQQQQHDSEELKGTSRLTDERPRKSPAHL